MEYVYIVTCVCTYMHVFANVCKCVSRPEVEIECFPNQCLSYMLNWDIWLNLALLFPRVWLPRLLQGLPGSGSFMLGLQWAPSPPALECALGSELPSSCWCGTAPVHVLFQCRIHAQAGYSLGVWL